jgi:hypothetical protein
MSVEVGWGPDGVDATEVIDESRGTTVTGENINDGWQNSIVCSVFAPKAGKQHRYVQRSNEGQLKKGLAEMMTRFGRVEERGYVPGMMKIIKVGGNEAVTSLASLGNSVDARFGQELAVQ